MLLNILSAFAMVVFVSAIDTKYKIVATENGIIRGICNKTLIKGVDYCWFKGVPYAKSPVGELRFRVSV